MNVWDQLLDMINPASRKTEGEIPHFTFWDLRRAGPSQASIFFSIFFNLSRFLSFETGESITQREAERYATPGTVLTLVCRPVAAYGPLKKIDRRLTY